MTADERSRLVLSFARVLYVNGQATEQTVSVKPSNLLIESRGALQGQLNVLLQNRLAVEIGRHWMMFPSA